MSDMETRMALVEQSYEQLDKRLEKVEGKIDELGDDMRQGQHSLIKVIIGSAGTIVASLLSVIIVVLMN